MIRLNYCFEYLPSLQEAETQGRRLVYYTGPGDKYKANAAVLVGGSGLRQD